MVRAWYLNEEEIKNVKEMNLSLPPKYVDLEDLYALCGAEFYEMNGQDEFQKFRQEKELNYEMKHTEFVRSDLTSTFDEHILTEDVYYLTVEGSGYLDVRDSNERWIRIEMVEKDLVCVKKHALRRFTEDKNELYSGKIYAKDAKIKCYKGRQKYKTAVNKVK
ncbi:unnamed protein product [Brassicogethes aeneus]|uniref:acireductone dioxygenase (Fe(2+)-requiring) n=1 Tax=Brassicogethes aeneus TaxID=1431903 RepID=A0A9P0B9N7_BRAAE|nr:unnamed protein product [Brassicogethes aeneus]